MTGEKYNFSVHSWGCVCVVGGGGREGEGHFCLCFPFLLLLLLCCGVGPGPHNPNFSADSPVSLSLWKRVLLVFKRRCDIQQQSIYIATSLAYRIYIFELFKFLHFNLTLFDSVLTQWLCAVLDCVGFWPMLFRGERRVCKYHVRYKYDWAQCLNWRYRYRNVP